MRTRSFGVRGAMLALGTMLLLSFGASGCGCGNTNGTTDGGAGMDSGGIPGMSYSYVTTGLRLPGPGETLGLDIDNNGTVDNALGNLLVSLGTLVGMGFDAQASIDGALMDGSLVMLWNLVNVNGFTTDSNMGVDFYLGEPAPGMDLMMYTGGGTFTVSVTSPMVNTLSGMIGGGALVTSPSDIPLVIPLPMMGGLPAQINVTLVEAAIQCPAVSDTELTTCVLGGAITQDQINTEIVPAIVSFINGAVQDAAVLDPSTGATVPCTADCPTGCPPSAMDGASGTCSSLSADAICSAWNGTDTGICVDSTNGVVGFVLAPTTDMDGDGVIVQSEIAPLLMLVLSLDLDLDSSFSTCTTGMCGDGVTACPGGDADCADACNADPQPGCETVRDALSIGLEVTARDATINGLN
jgi:hypothetical protein